MSTTDAVEATTSSTATGAPPAPTVSHRWDEWADRFAGSDPGLNRFRNALMSVLTIGITLEAEWLFVHFTHALEVATPPGRLSSAQAATIASANHEYLVVAMLLGAIVGMIAGFGVMDATARGQLTTMLFLPVPMVAALTVGIELGSHRVAALASFAVVLALGTYCRRFGPRGFIAGMLLFMGDFFGFFLNGAITLGDLGWVTAEIGVGLLVAIAVRFTLFYPSAARALARTQRSYVARARKVAALALAVFDETSPTERQVRRLNRQLVRLNEAALMIDAYFGDPAAVVDGSTAEVLHQRLFDIELTLTNIARFASALRWMDIPATQRDHIRLALLDLSARDPEGARRHAISLLAEVQEEDQAALGDDRAAVVLPHRFAGSVISFADAITEWIALGDHPARSDVEGDSSFTPSVALFGGWLPGSATVSATASMEPGRRWGDRIRLAPYSRTAIQMGVAVGGAVALGDALSAKRFYWAVIAAFITFMGANNSGEQIRKALFRVAGTVIGIAIGSGVVALVGDHTYWSIAVILVALLLGFYLMRINYAFMVVGITVMVSQLYVQLGEFSHALLWLRLQETALGAGVAIATVILILPLRTRRVARVALREHIQAISALVEHAGEHLLARSHDDGSASLRSDARAIDATYQALVTTVQPLRRSLSGAVDHATARSLQLASASRNYGRNLVLDTGTCRPLDAASAADVAQGLSVLRTSLDTLITALTGPKEGVYVRSSAIFDRAERRMDRTAPAIDGHQLAVRDLKLLDGSMAGLAEELGLAITDFDTVGVMAGH